MINEGKASIRTFAASGTMERRNVLLVSTLLLAMASVCEAQLVGERLAWSNLGKERWLKTELQVRKALRKDSLNMGANYVYAWFFFTEGNPQFNIDSASAQTQRTLAYFKTLKGKEKERRLRAPFDSVGLYRLKNLIDSAAFYRAKEENTEEAYAFFIQQFASATQQVQAIELQHEVAFLNALKENTYQRFANYLEKYPNSQRKEEAKGRYEKLLFEAKTKDKRLLSYSQFLKEYPQSPYRLQTERQIFELTTASGEINSFEEYCLDYPQSPFAKQARDFLYHIYKDKQQDVAALLNDSLRAVWQNEKRTWFPVWKNGAYGFIDIEGDEKLISAADTLDVDVICEGFSQDVLRIGNKLMARNGKQLATDVEEMNELGSGFLKVKRNGVYTILHKSGLVCLNYNATLIGQHFFLVSEKELSTLYTLAGRKILSGAWLQVLSFGAVVAFKTERGWQLISTKALGAYVNGGALSFTDYFEEVKLVAGDYLWVRSNSREALLSKELKLVLPFGDQTIQEVEKLLVVRTKEGARIFAHEKLSTVVESVIVSKQWIVWHSKTSSVLENRLTQKRFVYDSVAIRPLAFVGARNDTLFLHTENRIVSFSSSAQLEVFTIGENKLYAVVQQGSRTLLSAQGEKLTTLICDKLEYAGANVLVLTKKDKRTLVDLQGKAIPLTEFETFGNITTRDMAVLAKKKFGLLNNRTSQFIKPLYERSLFSYNDDLIVAFKDGAYGFITWENKPVGKFEFEEVRYWNDSVAWVRHNFSWRLLFLRDMTFQPGKISNYSLLQKTSGETLAIYGQDNYYGVMSNKSGIILEPTFTGIQNLGTPDEPLYFTEKFVEEAAIYVVIYYNEKGRQIRRQVFEEKEFERIKCED